MEWRERTKKHTRRVEKENSRWCWKISTMRDERRRSRVRLECVHGADGIVIVSVSVCMRGEEHSPMVRLIGWLAAAALLPHFIL